MMKPILFNTDMVNAILREPPWNKTVTRRVVKGDIPEDAIWEYTTFIPKGCILCRGPIGYGKKVFKLPYQKGDILYVRETWAFMNCINCNGDYRRPENDPPCYDTQAVEYDDGDSISDGCFIYRAGCRTPERITWRPSIHMPKAAARIFLRVTDVRVERLQDITEAQAVKEGIIRLYDEMPDAEYLDWTRRTGIYPKAKEEWGYKNYLWHGNFGMHGMGNKMSDAWKYQYSSYDSARDSFFSLWNTTVPLKDWNVYGCDANPWVWVIEFERCEKPESEG